MRRCGIIGGLGPAATIDLFRLIVSQTPASMDQEHLRIIIDNHPQIPERTAAILSGGESPVPYFLESIDILLKGKVDFIICPCNTAHYFLRQLKPEMRVPFLDMIDITVEFLHDSSIRSSGLLSSSGTLRSRLYQDSAAKYGIKIIEPSSDGVRKEMTALFGKEGIKAGAKFEKSSKNKGLLLEVVDEFKKTGAESVIMGCTEVPLCLDQSDTDLKLINPTELLARAAIRFALEK